MRTTTRLCSALALACLIALLPPGDSRAAVGTGSTVGAIVIPGGTSCGSVTYLQTVSPDSQYQVKGPGVVTSFRTLTGPQVGGPIAFKVARPASGVWRIVGTTGQLPAGPSTFLEHPARVPVAAGDILGMSFTQVTDCLAIRGGYVVDYVSGDAPVGSMSAGAYVAGYQLSIAATVEPDADRDTYGDLSQDGCRTDPTTQGTCASSAPRTAISRLTVANRTVRVVFRANEPATFRCAVDTPVYTACTSPLVRRLPPGRHTIAVVARDRYGNLDATPAIARFTVARR